MEQMEQTASLDERIDDVIELIRPAIQMDGGDLIFHGVEDGVVTVELVGACTGCAFSGQTLSAGVERVLMEKIPEVREVVAI